jgi:hypothetical protein
VLYALFEHTDTLIRLIDRRVARLWARASEEAKQKRGTGTTAEVFVVGVRDALSEKNTADQQIFAIKALLSELDTGKLKRPSLASLQRDILIGQTAQIRPLVKTLLALDLCSAQADHWPLLIEAWREFYRLELSGLTDRMCPPKSRAWAAFAKDCDSLRTRQAAEAQILWEIRQALRRGSLYVPHSLSYRAKKALFDTAGTTLQEANGHCPTF